MRTLRELIDWYFSKRTFPYWCVLLLDSLVLLFTSIFIYWCFNRGAALQRDFWPLLRFLSLCLCVHMVFFASFRTYSGIIRYSSFSDLLRVAYAMGVLVPGRDHPPRVHEPCAIGYWRRSSGWITNDADDLNDVSVSVG